MRAKKNVYIKIVNVYDVSSADFNDQKGYERWKMPSMPEKKNDFKVEISTFSFRRLFKNKN